MEVSTSGPTHLAFSAPITRRLAAKLSLSRGNMFTSRRCLACRPMPSSALFRDSDGVLTAGEKTIHNSSNGRPMDHLPAWTGNPDQAFARPSTSRTTSSASAVVRHQWEPS